MSLQIFTYVMTAIVMGLLDDCQAALRRQHTSSPRFGSLLITLSWAREGTKRFATLFVVAFVPPFLLASIFGRNTGWLGTYKGTIRYIYLYYRNPSKVTSSRPARFKHYQIHSSASLCGQFVVSAINKDQSVRPFARLCTPQLHCSLHS